MKNYFKYAFGEIILVVIGILIAMYIKGKYTESQEQKHIERTTIQVIKDLRADTTQLNAILKTIEPREEIFLSILADTMDIDDFKNCNECAYLISSLQPFEPVQSGYLILKDLETDLISSQDSLIHDTKLFYSMSIPMFTLLVDMLKEDVSSNLKDWRDTQPWYADWVQGKSTDELIAYMANDPSYRNKVANYYLLLYKNYLRALRNYNSEASKLADRWEVELNK
tara:strand:- start:1303 stop:1977 length:675 start_codon:yes stop_codon:yes gene_type:complete